MSYEYLEERGDGYHCKYWGDNMTKNMKINICGNKKDCTECVKNG